MGLKEIDNRSSINPNIRMSIIQAMTKLLAKSIQKDQGQKVCEYVHLDETESCSLIVPPALARTCKIPSLIISLSSFRRLTKSFSVPMNKDGQY